MFLFLSDIYNFVQTKISFLKTFIYLGILILPIPLLILEFRTKQNSFKQILRKIIPFATIIGLILLNPMKILFNTQTWKTQKIELINENMINHKVEYQMKDIGSLGYAKRTTEVIYLTKYFYFVWAEKYDERNFLGHKWKSVDIDINEIGLK